MIKTSGQYWFKPPLKLLYDRIIDSLKGDLKKFTYDRDVGKFQGNRVIKGIWKPSLITIGTVQKTIFYKILLVVSSIEVST